MTRRRGSFWPSPTQERLLRTALGESAEGLEAWRSLAGFQVPEVEPGTFPVLPLVYRAVSRMAPDDPELARLKGIYRNSWLKNNLMLETVAESLTALEEAGVEPLMVGSLPAAVRYYAELALRPTATLDFVLATDALVPAVRALGQIGWRAPAPVHTGAEGPVTMTNAKGQVCLLLTAIAPDFSPSTELLLAASVELELGGRIVRAAAPGDDLLIACARGGRVWPVRSVQWLIDAVQILRSAPEKVDWERLLELAGEHLQTVRVREALRYLEEVAGTPLTAPASLGRRQVSRRERLAYRCAGAAVPGLGSLPQAVSEHLCSSREASPLRTARAFPGFLQRRWGLEHPWQLPGAAGQRALRDRDD